LHSSRTTAIVVQAFVKRILTIFASSIGVRLSYFSGALAHDMQKPEHGDRILILKPEWLHLILSGHKTLEIRGSRLKAGPCLFGCGGKIYASARLGVPSLVEDVAQWIALRKDHCVQTNDLPYRKTYALPIKKVKQLAKEVPYVHKRGAIGIVRYDSSRV
jgi:hypothetical protein